MTTMNYHDGRDIAGGRRVMAEVDEYRQAATGMCLGFFIDANEKMMR